MKKIGWPAATRSPLPTRTSISMSDTWACTDTELHVATLPKDLTSSGMSRRSAVATVISIGLATLALPASAALLPSCLHETSNEAASAPAASSRPTVNLLETTEQPFLKEIPDAGWRTSI